MTEILVMGDSHGHLGKISDLIKIYKDRVIWVHLGDRAHDCDPFLEEMKPLYRVEGNMDLKSVAPVEQVFSVDNTRIFITHGHKYKVHNNLKLLVKRAVELKADVVFYGHTHEKYYDTHKGIFFLSPGALKDGFYALVKVEDGAIVDYKYLKI